MDVSVCTSRSMDLRSRAIGHSPMAFGAARASGSQARPLTPAFAGMAGKGKLFKTFLSRKRAFGAPSVPPRTIARPTP